MGVGIASKFASCCATTIVLLACGGSQTAGSSSTPTPTPIPSPQLGMAVLGDSIASGSSYGGRGSTGWPYLVAQQLGLRSLLCAQPGTGYTTGDPSGSGKAYTAGTRLNCVVESRPDIVIVEGSRNDDDGAKTEQAAIEVLGKLRKELPQAKFIVIGPFYLDKTDGGTTPVNEAVKAAAMSLGLTYVDTIKAGWFSGSARRFVADDGIHPTDEGHRYLASLVVPLVKGMLPAGYPVPTPSC